VDACSPTVADTDDDAQRDVGMPPAAGAESVATADSQSLGGFSDDGVASRSIGDVRDELSRRLEHMVLQAAAGSEETTIYDQLKNAHTVFAPLHAEVAPPTPEEVVMRCAVQNGKVESRSTVGWNFDRTCKSDLTLKADYKKCGSNKEKEAFRLEWARGRLTYFVKSRTYTKSFARVDITKGIYRPFARIAVEQGGDKAAYKAALRYVLKCIQLGPPWTLWNDMTDRLDFLDLEKGFTEELSQAWSNQQREFNDQRTIADVAAAAATGTAAHVAPVTTSRVAAAVTAAPVAPAVAAHVAPSVTAHGAPAVTTPPGMAPAVTAPRVAHVAPEAPAVANTNGNNVKGHGKGKGKGKDKGKNPSATTPGDDTNPNKRTHDDDPPNPNKKSKTKLQEVIETATKNKRNYHTAMSSMTCTKTNINTDPRWKWAASDSVSTELAVLAGAITLTQFMEQFLIMDAKDMRTECSESELTVGLIAFNKLGDPILKLQAFLQKLTRMHIQMLKA